MLRTGRRFIPGSVEKDRYECLQGDFNSQRSVEGAASKPERGKRDRELVTLIDLDHLFLREFGCLRSAGCIGILALPVSEFCVVTARYHFDTGFLLLRGKFFFDHGYDSCEWRAEIR